MDIKIIPQELIEMLDYCPNTGQMWWAVDYGRRIKAGTPVKNICAQGYSRVVYKKSSYKAHRVAYKMHYSAEPPPVIDHINGVKSDNRICNLRAATHSENSLNRQGQHGVTFHPDRSGGCWIATYRSKWLYEGRDQFEAWCRRKSAEHQ